MLQTAAKSTLEHVEVAHVSVMLKTAANSPCVEWSKAFYASGERTDLNPASFVFMVAPLHANNLFLHASQVR